MSEELLRQRDYWNREITQFEAIYSHKKNFLSTALDKIFRKDMYDRFVYTLKNAEPIVGRTVLDVGCGTGRYIMALLERGCRHATGIDISEQMIGHCRERAASQGFAEKTEFIRTDLLDFTPGATFDVCIGIGLFDYISDPLPVLRKMHDCTGDRLIASFPRLWTWRAPVRKLRLAMRGCNVRFFTKKQIRDLLLAAGFNSISLEKVGKLYCCTAGVR
jgi:SAM-dependent methyltransferase